MGEKLPIALTEHIHARFGVPVLGAFPVAGREKRTVQAALGQAGPLAVSEAFHRLHFHELPDGRFKDIAYAVGGIHKVVADIQVPVVLNHGIPLAGLSKDAHPFLLAAPDRQGGIEELHVVLPNIGAHPLIKHIAHILPERLR